MANAELRADNERQALPNQLHLGCGKTTLDGWHNVDKVPLEDVDETVDLDEKPWPFPSDHFQRIRADHVVEHLAEPEAALREMARVLCTDGTATVRVPVGINSWADPDHKTRWTWETPEFYTGARHWDCDVGLTVVDRDVTVHTHLSGIAKRAYRYAIARYRDSYGPGRWLFDLPMTSGEFEVVYRA